MFLRGVQCLCFFSSQVFSRRTAKHPNIALHSVVPEWTSVINICNEAPRGKENVMTNMGLGGVESKRKEGPPQCSVHHAVMLVVKNHLPMQET